MPARRATASGHTDERGLFVLEGLPAGLVEVRVDAPPLTGRVELPAGPSDVARDVSVSVPDCRRCGSPRPQDAWGADQGLARSRPLSQSDASGLERLAALVALDPAFRLAMVTPAAPWRAAPRRCRVLQRYLTGPALVLANADLRRLGIREARQLELIFMRLEEGLVDGSVASFLSRGAEEGTELSRRSRRAPACRGPPLRCERTAVRSYQLSSTTPADRSPQREPPTGDGYAAPERRNGAVLPTIPRVWYNAAGALGLSSSP